MPSPSLPSFLETESHKIIFDVYLLSDIRFMSSLASNKFSDNDLSDINISFEIKMSGLYDRLRNALEEVVLEEFADHFSSRCRVNDKRDSCIRHLTIVKKRDFSSIFYCFKNLRWDKFYGGRKWGIATEFLLKNPKTCDDKMFWIDRVLDLEHNTGGIFKGKDVEFSELYSKYPISVFDLRKKDIHNKTVSNILDIRAIIPSCYWSLLCSNDLWNSVYKYVRKLRPIYLRG